MDKLKKKRKIRIKKKKQIRSIISGTKEKPRLSIFRSLMHVSVQAIDDVNGQTIASSSSLEKSMREKLKGKPANLDTSKEVGVALGEKLKNLGINNAVFDRNGYIYHGRVKAIADAIRETGLVI